MGAKNLGNFSSLKRKVKERNRRLKVINEANEPEEEKKMIGFFINVLDEIWWVVFYAEVVRKVQPGEVETEINKEI